MEEKRVWRQIHVPLNKPRRLDSVFWWLAGIAIAVAFLACVAMAYAAHRAQLK
jgi:hypothetical protein